MARKEIDRELMLNYLQGNCTARQLYIIREWLNDEAYRASLDEFLQEEWGDISRQPQPSMPGMDEQYEKFRSYLERESPVQAAAVPATRVVRLPWRIAGIAAALLLLLVATWLLQSRRGRGKGAALAEQWVVFHNQPGKKQRLLLPDSSIVYVASASTLKYNKDFSRTHRRILLEGEAYFVVKHDAALPFTVVTGDIRTVDIGTEFNIRSYPDRPSIEVAVAKGKVEVQHEKTIGGAPIGAIGQGQMLQYDPLTTKAVTINLPDAGMVGAWRKGILSFRKQPLKEITDEMEKYYGISIRYTDPAHEHILLTTLLDNNSLEEAMEIVTVTAGIHYARQGDTIVLK